MKHPADAIGREAGRIGVGSSDLVLFDPKAVRTLDNRQSLYDGETLYGAVADVFRAS